MSAVRYNPDTHELTLNIQVMLQTTTPPITDPLCVPYLARCDGKAI